MTQSMSVAMERWSVEHRAFAVKTCFKNNDSVVTHRIFCRHFNIQWNDSVPSHNTVLLWVRNFRATVSAAKKKRKKEKKKKKNPGTEPSLRTPENIERVRQAFVRSPR